MTYIVTKPNNVNILIIYTYKYFSPELFQRSVAHSICSTVYKNQGDANLIISNRLASSSLRFASTFYLYQKVKKETTGTDQILHHIRTHQILMYQLHETLKYTTEDKLLIKRDNKKLVLQKKK